MALTFSCKYAENLSILQPKCVVNKAVRSAASLDKHGQNIEAHWRPDAAAVAVLVCVAAATLLLLVRFMNDRAHKLQTSKGYLLIYHGIAHPNRNQPHSARALQLALPGDAVHVAGWGEAHGAAAGHLIHINTIRLQSLPTAMCARGETLDMATRDCTVQAVTWGGTSDQDESFFVADISLPDDAQMPTTSFFTHIVYSRTMRVHAAVLSTGHAVVYSRPGPDVVGSATEACGAVHVALNARNGLLAVGCCNGKVLVYGVDGPTLGPLSHVCAGPLASGPVSALAWAPDDMALAVGHGGGGRGGLVLWSALGMRVYAACAEAGDDGESWPAVTCVAWGAGGYTVAVGVESPTGEFVDVQCMRAALATTTCEANRQCVLLAGADRLMLYGEGRGGKPKSWLWRDIDRLCDVPWDIIPLPTAFAADNWPIKYACVNDSVDMVAVAGMRGIAYFDLDRRRWTLCGNHAFEQDLSCRGGLVWWSKMLVVPTNDNVVRLYAGGLEAAHEANALPVGAPVAAVNVCAGHLWVLTTAHHVLIYAAVPEVRIVRRVALSATLGPARISPLGAYIGYTAATHTLVTVMGGRLCKVRMPGLRLDFEDDGVLEAGAGEVLAEAVEMVWCDAGTSPRLYALTTGGTVMVCTQGGAVTFSLNMYPLVVISDAGVVLGVEAADTVGMAMAGTPYEAVHVDHKTQIYTHHVLRELIKAARDDEALALGRMCQAQAYWGHVLELLIHSVLDDDSAPANLLPRIVAFTTHFPEHLDALAHTARKTEVALWPALFAHAHTPRALFEECLHRGKLHTAASYLVVLQSLEAPALSRQRATRLLNTALDADQWQLARDLMRFLAAIADDHQFSDAANPPDHGADVRSVGTQTDVLPNMDKFYVDVLLARYARRLLTTNHIRALGLFSLNLAFPLKSWLRRERCRAAVVNDYETALNALHEQYEWAPQPVSTAGAALTRSNTTGGTLTHTQVPRLHRSISVSLAALTRTRAHAPCNPMREVRHMLDLCLVTGCYDWAALLATMLQSQRDLHAVLASAKADREYYGGADHVVDKLRAVAASDIGAAYRGFLDAAL